MSLKKTAACLLVLSLLIPSLVLAKEVNWVIDERGDLEIENNENTYIVTQNDLSVASSNRILVGEGVKTQITLNGVNLSNHGLSPLDIGPEASVTIVLQGENRLAQTDDTSWNADRAALHISSGSLVIEGDGSLEARVEGTTYDADGAGIGSHGSETMSGSIEIRGKAKVSAQSKCGAAIGGGEYSEMNGDIRVLDEAKLRLETKEGSGIGSGRWSNMSGSVILKDNAKVEIVAGRFGVGLGAGAGKSFTESGSVTVTDNAELSFLPGTSFIAIGNNWDSNKFYGKISILEHAKIQGEDKDGNPLVIGGGPTFSTENESGFFEISKGATINGFKAESAKILIDNKLVNIYMVEGEPQNLTLVEPTPEPDPPTPPTPPTPPAPKVVPSITTVGLHTLHAGKVSVGPVGASTTGLLESNMDPVFDLSGNVLYQGKLAFVGETPSQGFTLSVNVGLENAGKAFDLLLEHDGQVSRTSVLANAQGLVSLPLMYLGNFAVIAK